MGHTNCLGGLLQEEGKQVQSWERRLGGDGSSRTREEKWGVNAIKIYHKVLKELIKVFFKILHLY